MVSVFSALLEACDPERNRWRSYRVQAGQDLFGTWLVAVTFGRIGSPRSRTRTYVVHDEAGAQRLARACLRRRASAPRRIGVEYVTRELVDPNSWITADRQGV
jgi:WGR domain-containing protein